MLDVEMAKLELSRKSITEIHTDTAWKWASRACAAFQISKAAKSGAGRAIKFSEAQEYLSEAREHAAQVNPALVEKINDEVSKDFMDALLDMDQALKGKENV